MIVKVRKLGYDYSCRDIDGTFHFNHPKLQLMADYFGDCESVNDIIDNMKEYDEVEDDEDLGYWRRILGGVKLPDDEMVHLIPKEFFSLDYDIKRITDKYGKRRWNPRVYKAVKRWLSRRKNGL